jgi:DNA-binding CsgD family transcriptional regulator
MPPTAATDSWPPPDPRCGGELLLDAQGRPDCGAPLPDATLAAAIGGQTWVAACERARAQGLSALAIPRPGRLPLTLRLAWQGDGLCAAVVDPEACRPVPALLQALFGLTDAEARVVAGLAEGRSTDELARDHGVQLNTVQRQLKEALQKTGLRRQTQLVSLALRSAATCRTAAAPPAIRGVGGSDCPDGQ